MSNLPNILAAVWSADDVRRILHELGTILATLLSIFTLFVAWDAKRKTKENKGNIDDLQVKHDTNQSDIKDVAKATVEIAHLVPKDTTKVEQNLKAIISKPPMPAIPPEPPRVQI